MKVRLWKLLVAIGSVLLLMVTFWKWRIPFIRPWKKVDVPDREETDRRIETFSEAIENRRKEVIDSLKWKGGGE